MEKKKLLLVAISVGVFLVIVIGASILVFSPRSPSPAAVAIKPSAGRPIPVEGPEDIELPEPPASMDATELMKNPGDIRDLQIPPASNRSAQDNVFYIYGENAPSAADPVERAPANTNANARVVIDVPRPVTAAVPDAPRNPPRATVSSVQPTTRQNPTVDTPKPAAAPRPAADTPKPAAAASRPVAAAPKPAAAASKPAATTATVAAKPASASPARVYDNYWVQTGAFSTKVRAEGVKETLASKGIISLIENHDAEGKTLYRVRVGPYTSKNEADYWLTLIKSIHGFEESQVWKTPVRL
jgi:DedD protein